MLSWGRLKCTAHPAAPKKPAVGQILFPGHRQLSSQGEASAPSAPSTRDALHLSPLNPHGLILGLEALQRGTIPPCRSLRCIPALLVKRGGSSRDFCNAPPGQDAVCPVPVVWTRSLLGHTACLTRPCTASSPISCTPHFSSALSSLSCTHHQSEPPSSLSPSVALPHSSGSASTLRTCPSCLSSLACGVTIMH